MAQLATRQPYHRAIRIAQTMEVVMSSSVGKTFETPDEVRTFDKGRV
jgi:hypothetical protein